jgi:hypothetical protein
MIWWITGLALADPALYAGLPLTEIAALELQPPTLSRVTSELRFGLAEGGYVVLSVSPTLDEAKAAFTGRVETSATRWPPADKGLPGDEAVGDGQQIVLLRDRNVVLTVRDTRGQATAIAERILYALTTDEAVCAPILREEDDPLRGQARWDVCGRLR